MLNLSLQHLALLPAHAARGWAGPTLACFAADAESRTASGPWAALMQAGNYQEAIVPGDHQSCLRAPHVAMLAARLDTAPG